MAQKFKIQFTLDESDLNFFRALFRKARQEATQRDSQEIVKVVQELIKRVTAQRKIPSLVQEATRTLEDLIEMLSDEDYALPKRVSSEVIAALAYFADPQDLIPDEIPGLGFLDDAIMIKLLENEFQHELWGYRKFRRFRQGAEQRPWTSVAKARLPQRLEAQRKDIRGKIDQRKRERPSSWW